ncbi:MAG: SDR family NAD-dependent epimerase/dehydratase, partial [Planctomycetota bacterium]
CFCYVDDLIEGLIKLMNSCDDFTGPVNLGSFDEISMLELAQKITSLTGSKSEIAFKPLPEDDPRRRQPETSLAKENLGWEPKTRLEDGLSKTIEYFGEMV